MKATLHHDSNSHNIRRSWIKVNSQRNLKSKAESAVIDPGVILSPMPFFLGNVLHFVLTQGAGGHIFPNNSTMLMTPACSQ